MIVILCTIVFQIFRKHFSMMLLYDFPEHYGEILSLLLKSSETQSICPVVWYDLLNSLLEPSGSKGKFKQGVGFGVIRDEARRFATEMQSLSYKEVKYIAFVNFNLVINLSEGFLYLIYTCLCFGIDF